MLVFERKLSKKITKSSNERLESHTTELDNAKAQNARIFLFLALWLWVPTFVLVFNDNYHQITTSSNERLGSHTTGLHDSKAQNSRIFLFLALGLWVPHIGARIWKENSQQNDEIE